MRQSKKFEFGVGLFLLLALASLLFLALKVANIQGIGSEKQYDVSATFTNIGGLKERAPVRIGGVVVGRVVSIKLDPKSYQPVVTIGIDSEYNHIPTNSSLAIKTSGLLGEQYISINVGFDDGETAMLKNGDVIYDTTSALVLEDLIGQFLYGDKK